MKKNVAITLTVVFLVLLLLIAAGAFFYMWRENTKIEDKTKNSSDFVDIFKGLKDIGGEVNLGEEYKILYGKSNNVITASGVADLECNNFTLNKYLGGGIVDKDGSNNVNLELTDYPTSYPMSKYYSNFYYISAADNPASEIMGTVILDRNYQDQSLYEANFANKETSKIVSPTDNQFPGGLKLSPDNKYLVYVMTNKKDEKFGGLGLNSEDRDSDLIVRDNLTGKERKVIEGNYNRQLFNSFIDFSKTEEALYTIEREENTYKFVKIYMDTGEVIDFNQVFTNFDWSKVKWDQLFNKDNSNYPVHFSMSPDESMLLAYENIVDSNSDNICAPNINHNIWSFNTDNDTIDKIDEGLGAVTDLDWKDDGSEFAFSSVSRGGCYPEYLDSSVTEITKNGQNKGVLVEEKEGKIVNLSYAPWGVEIVYDVYESDFVSYLKSINLVDGEVSEIISTNETEDNINQEKPVTLMFINWVGVE